MTGRGGDAACRPLGDERPAAVEARGLTHRYPGSARAALDNVDLQLNAGEVVGLLGPNGAGKTTVISILSTLFRPDGGTVRINGRELTGHPRAVRRMIGLVPQEIALYPSLTARENLRFFGRMQGLRGDRLDRRISDVLTAVGLETRAGQRVAAFSGGMQRRANLAVGMLHDPQLLYLDEPTVGIDAQSRRLIMARIRTMRDRGAAVLYSTHYMEEAQQLCTRVVILDRGRVISQGPVDRLLAQHPGCRDLGELFLTLTGKALRDT